MLSTKLKKFGMAIPFIVFMGVKECFDLQILKLHLIVIVFPLTLNKNEGDWVQNRKATPTSASDGVTLSSNVSMNCLYDIMPASRSMLKLLLLQQVSIKMVAELITVSVDDWVEVHRSYHYVEMASFQQEVIVGYHGPCNNISVARTCGCKDGKVGCKVFAVVNSG